MHAYVPLPSYVMAATSYGQCLQLLFDNIEDFLDVFQINLSEI